MPTPLMDRIIELMVEKGWVKKSGKPNQSALAEASGLSEEAISKWFVGFKAGRDAKPDIESLVALANTFGVTLDSLLGLDHELSKDEMVRACIREIGAYTKRIEQLIDGEK
ncbi:MAG: helix-turn-helix transcriptional regulator [Candidatus Krumholzibacteriia bacterium]